MSDLKRRSVLELSADDLETNVWVAAVAFQPCQCGVPYRTDVQPALQIQRAKSGRAG